MYTQHHLYNPLIHIQVDDTSIYSHKNKEEIVVWIFIHKIYLTIQNILVNQLTKCSEMKLVKQKTKSP